MCNIVMFNTCISLLLIYFSIKNLHKNGVKNCTKKKKLKKNANFDFDLVLYLLIYEFIMDLN